MHKRVMWKKNIAFTESVLRFITPKKRFKKKKESEKRKNLRQRKEGEKKEKKRAQSAT